MVKKYFNYLVLCTVTASLIFAAPIQASVITKAPVKIIKIAGRLVEMGAGTALMGCSIVPFAMGAVSQFGNRFLSDHKSRKIVQGVVNDLNVELQKEGVQVRTDNLDQTLDSAAKGASILAKGSGIAGFIFLIPGMICFVDGAKGLYHEIVGKKEEKPEAPQPVQTVHVTASTSAQPQQSNQNPTLNSINTIN